MIVKPYPVIDMEKTGRNIRALRLASGYTVRDVQQWFGFENPQAVYRWQSGKSLPGIDNLCALSFLLDVTIDDILVLRPYSLYIPFSQSPSAWTFLFALRHTDCGTWVVSGSGFPVIIR